MNNKVSTTEFLALIRDRRSIRRFIEDRSVPDHIINRILEAGRWAPSAHNRQPWHFVVLTRDPDKHKLAEAMAAQLIVDRRADGHDEQVIMRDAERSKNRLTGAPVLILVCLSMINMDHYPDNRRQRLEHQMAVQSVAMAAQNMLLQAHAEGLGAVWMCAPLFCPDVVRQTLTLPDDFEPQGIIALGYPAEERIKTRHPLESRVIWT